MSTATVATENKNLIEGKTGLWEVVIGMEVHAQVLSKSKLFSGASVAFGAEPNSQVSLVDAAMPGMLPVINDFCVEQAVRTGLGLKAQINLRSVFDRKNYFYPDLPQGYQISQFTQPIVGKGELIIDLPGGESRTVGITRLHLEQDAGKSIHDQDPQLTFIDLNRSGTALMEIVSEPDMRSAEEAAAYLKKLRSILRYLGTCDGNMDEGSLRADVNVSVRKPGAPFGTRCEIKNVNSIRFVQQAVEYESRRQIELIEEGGTVKQQTRLFDAGRGETRAMRTKEEAHDYRYFPDPDLLPLELDPDFVARIKATLPELPDEKKERFVKIYGCSPYLASILVAEKEVAEEEELKFKARLKEKLSASDFSILETSAAPGQPDYSPLPEPLRVSVSASSTFIANTTVTSVFSVANEMKKDPVILIRELDLGGLDRLIDEKIISTRLAKDVFAEMVLNSKKTAQEIVEEKGLKQITDTGPIEAAADKVIADNPKQVATYKGGNQNLIGWFVGQVMKATGGKANPGVVNEILRKKLAE